jgi:hypothetical protein
MTTYYRLYAKFEGQNKFKPIDLSTGQQVTNLIHATMIPEEKIEYLTYSLKENEPEIEFKIEKIN